MGENLLGRVKVRKSSLILPLISSFAHAHNEKSCTQGLRYMKLYWLRMLLRTWLARGLYASDFDSFEQLSGIACVPSGVGG